MLASCLRAIGVLGVLTQALPSEDVTVRGNLQPQACSNPQGPDMMFVLDEARLDSWLPVNNTIFQVSQNAATNGGKLED